MASLVRQVEVSGFVKCLFISELKYTKYVIFDALDRVLTLTSCSFSYEYIYIYIYDNITWIAGLP